MMNTFRKFTCRSLRLNKKRTALTILGITLSVALIVALTSIVSSLYNSKIENEKKKEGDFQFMLADVPDDCIASIDANRKIEGCYTTHVIGYADIGSENPDKPYACIISADKESMANLSFNLTEGRLPENGNEIVIPKHLKTNGRVDLNIGDEITLNVGKRIYNGEENKQMFYVEGETLTDTVSKSYTIVGIMERPGYLTENYSAPGYTFLTYDENPKGELTVYVRMKDSYIRDYLEVLAGILMVDEDIFIKSGGGQNIDDNEIMEKLNDELEHAAYNYDIHSGLVSYQTYTSYSYGSHDVVLLFILMLVVAAIIVATSIFCIRNSFDISITDKIRQYGMLASIGATKRQIKKNVYFEAAVLGLIGIPIGIAAGILASYILVCVVNLLIGSQITMKIIFSVSGWCIIFAIILGIVTIFLSSAKSARRASHISPITAIRNPDSISGRTEKFKTPSYIRKIFGMGGVISYKNLKRNRKKYRTISITIGVCTIAFIALSSFMSLMYREAELEYGRQSYNISVGIFDGDDGNTAFSKAEGIYDMDNIDRCAVIRNAVMTMDNVKVTDEYMDYLRYMDGDDSMSDEEILKEYGTNAIRVLSLGDKEYEEYAKSLGLNPDKLDGKGILVNVCLAYYTQDDEVDIRQIDTFDYSDGEFICGTIENYNTNEKIKADIEVAATTDKQVMGYDNYYIDGYLVVSDSYMDTLPYNSGVTVYIESPDADTLQDEIEEYLGDGSNYFVNNYDSQYQDNINFMMLIKIFAYGFIIVIALIGITNVINTINTSMELRTGEFAMLKSVGMTKKEFNNMVSLETVFYGVKSLSIGIIAGSVLSYVIYRLLVGSEIELRYHFPVGAVIISIVVIFVLLFCIMRFSIRKINRKNIIDAIKNENI